MKILIVNVYDGTEYNEKKLATKAIQSNNIRESTGKWTIHNLN